MDVLAEIRYQKIRPIGIGEGMNSEVFLAFDPQLNAEIAVKEIQKANLGNSATSYFNEAGLMFASTHPHVVPPFYGATLRIRSPSRCPTTHAVPCSPASKADLSLHGNV